MENVEVTNKTLRQFGLMVGGVFLVIGLWPFLWRQEAIREWAVVLGALLSVAGLAVPAILKYLYQGWMWVGHVMGWINTRIILGVLFYGIVTPMAGGTGFGPTRSRPRRCPARCRPCRTRRAFPRTGSMPNS